MDSELDFNLDSNLNINLRTTGSLDPDSRR